MNLILKGLLKKIANTNVPFKSWAQPLSVTVNKSHVITALYICNGNRNIFIGYTDTLLRYMYPLL